MNAPQSPPPPAWVRKRDGRLVPFEADRICRALFSASESIAQPDAFLARELADVAVHFLADECEGTTPTTAQVHDIVVKVLGELKQHALAAAYQEKSRARRVERPADAPRRGEAVVRFTLAAPPDAVQTACLRSYSLQSVFTRDLAAAHQDGLLTLGGLETPTELASCLVPPYLRPEDLLARLGEAAEVAGQTLVIDGCEHILARSLTLGQKKPSRPRLRETVARMVSTIRLARRLTGRQIVVNLNTVAPPWADEGAGGPLFAEQQRVTEPSLCAELAGDLAEGLLQVEAGNPDLRVGWHLSEDDFAPEANERLVELAGLALSGSAIHFTFDRPRRTVSLGEGLKRNQPAVLMAIGLNLPRLAALVREERLPGTGESSSARLLDKVRSLTRLALSAALQKREYLRQQARSTPGLASGFLLERARLLVVPLGLDEMAALMAGHGVCAAAESLELGKSVLRRLREVLEAEGRSATLETCLDAAPWHGQGGGPTCWDREAPVKSQLQALGELHSASGGGTGTLFLPHDPPPTSEQAAGWLRWAWGQTQVASLRLLRSRPPLRQLTFPEA
jgi:hypothetical protein